MRQVLCALTLVLLTGCSAIRFGGQAAPELGGSWAGSIELQGQVVQGTLNLDQEGATLEGVLTAASVDLMARGRGEVAPEGEFWLDLSYDLECPGSISILGQFGQGDLLSGTLVARDCTGTARGTFRLSPLNQER